MAQLKFGHSTRETGEWEWLALENYSSVKPLAISGFTTILGPERLGPGAMRRQEHILFDSVLCQTKHFYDLVDTYRSEHMS